MTHSQNQEPYRLPCPSWVWCASSNTHVAKDRTWFADDYTPFDSYITSIAGGESQVIGIGTVHLPTQVAPNSAGPRFDSTLTLKNVLHVPDITCNIIGSPVSGEYHIDPTGAGVISTRSTGTTVGHFKPQVEGFPRFEVQLSRPPFGPLLGPSPFNPSTRYTLNAIWPAGEQARFRTARVAASEPLTNREREWLNEKYESEARFFQVYGLCFDNDEDRAEGHAIVRIAMEHEEDETPNGY